MKGMKEHYDMSEYSKESGLYEVENIKVLGKFKDESPDEVIESFVAIRSKCYTFKTKKNVVKKTQGVSKIDLLIFTFYSDQLVIAVETGIVNK